MKYFFFYFLCFSLISCFDFSKNRFYNIGEKFEYGYYNGSLSLLNIYYSELGGIFPYQCTTIRWNKTLIYVECTDKNNGIYYYILDKAKYQKEPKQIESRAIVGPLNYDSLIKTNFFNDTEISKNILSIENFK